MRRTKIVCTLGPATDRDGVLEKMIEAGMNVARFNFSHGTYPEHKQRLEQLVTLRDKLEQPVAALLDTKGPEIRLMDFEGGKIELVEGQKFTLTTRPLMGTTEIASITYKDLPNDISEGTKILIDDGLIELLVRKISGEDIVCDVINGGFVSNHKGINVPNAKLSMPYLSQRDKEDILFGVENDFDFIAASFVREAADVQQIRDLLSENGGEAIRIIAKIENKQGVDNIDDIIEAADGIMVARGDMGVELPGEDVPIIQKMIIKKVYEAGKQVITATQMLDSMMKNPRPTRAETTDVANAVFDGTSAIMLSGETAAGLYPLEALETMVCIAKRAEKAIDYKKRFFTSDREMDPDVTEAISHATCTTALDLNAKAIVTVTKSGNSARMVSKYRPACEIIACAMDEKVRRQLSLVWGVKPLLLPEKQDLFELFGHAVDIAAQSHHLKKGDIVVITSGIPIGMSGTTNMIKVQVVEKDR